MALVIDNTHTAPGQMAGYLFQPDRALVLLCSCKSKESVSIELVDDVAAVDDNNNVIYREQDKSSIQAEGQPFKDRSKDLWNTLMIWINEIKAGTLKIETTRLVCVTNKKLDKNSLINKIAAAKKDEEIASVLLLLKSAATLPPLGIKEIIESVIAEGEILRQLIPQITVIEENTYETRTTEIAEALSLTDNIKDNVIESLRGWLNQSILKQLEKGQAPIIKKSDFNNRFEKAVKKETDDRLIFKIKSFVQSSINKVERDTAANRTFVKQLELIEHPDKNEILLDAIDDFLCSESERTRLTLRGDLDREDLSEMDEACKERWKEAFRRKRASLRMEISEVEMAELAFEIYDSTISGYISTLRGFATNSYLTKGTFHRLADIPEIGWHPDWEKYFPKE